MSAPRTDKANQLVAGDNNSAAAMAIEIQAVRAGNPLPKTWRASVQLSDSRRRSDRNRYHEPIAKDEPIAASGAPITPSESKSTMVKGTRISTSSSETHAGPRISPNAVRIVPWVLFTRTAKVAKQITIVSAT